MFTDSESKLEKYPCMIYPRLPLANEISDYTNIRDIYFFTEESIELLEQNNITVKNAHLVLEEKEKYLKLHHFNKFFKGTTRWVQEDIFLEKVENFEQSSLTASIKSFFVVENRDVKRLLLNKYSNLSQSTMPAEDKRRLFHSLQLYQLSLKNTCLFPSILEERDFKNNPKFYSSLFFQILYIRLMLDKIQCGYNQENFENLICLKELGNEQTLYFYIDGITYKLKTNFYISLSVLPTVPITQVTRNEFDNLKFERAFSTGVLRDPHYRNSLKYLFFVGYDPRSIMDFLTYSQALGMRDSITTEYKERFIYDTVYLANNFYSTVELGLEFKNIVTKHKDLFSTMDSSSKQLGMLYRESYFNLFYNVNSSTNYLDEIKKLERKVDEAIQDISLLQKRISFTQSHVVTLKQQTPLFVSNLYNRFIFE
jgi:hypothetical protein